MFDNEVNAKPGQFVSFTMHKDHWEPEDIYGLRQGMYIGGETVMFESSKEEIRAENIFAIVIDKRLFSDTLEWVKEWRASNL